MINNNVNATTEAKPFPVFSASLAFKLVEMGYFDKMCGIGLNRRNNGKKVYFFENEDGIIENIVNDYSIRRNELKELGDKLLNEQQSRNVCN